MFFGQYAPWENCPKKLRHFEVVNPLLVIIDFFSANLMTGHYKKLKKWRHYAVKDKVFKDKRHGPGSLLFFYDMNIKLLEAAYLLYYNDRIAKNEKVIVSITELEAERKHSDDFPENLSHKEMYDPYQAVKKVFRKISLQQYRDYLHEWLYAALSEYRRAQGDLRGLFSEDIQPPCMGGNAEQVSKGKRQIHRLAAFYQMGQVQP